MLRRALAYLRRNHVALLALFVALGGTSYAAVKLPANSVGTKQLRNGAVVSKKVADGTLGAVDLSAAARTALKGQTGPQGPAGAQGPQGPAGPKGDRGSDASLTRPLASGETESGAFSGSDSSPATGHYLLATGAFFPNLPHSVAADHVIYVSAGTATHCTAIGQADPGYLCIYPTLSSKIAMGSTPSVYGGNGTTPGAGQYGFGIVAAEDTSVGSLVFATLDGVFTYTEP